MEYFAYLCKNWETSHNSKLFIVKTDWYENKRGKNRKHQKAYQKKGKYQSETPIGHQQAFERGWQMRWIYQELQKGSRIAWKQLTL